MNSNNSNANQVYDLLVSTYKYSPDGAKAIMTNANFESGLNPQAYNPNSGAGGIFQWIGDRKNNLINYCTNNDLNPASIEGQVAFMDYELKTVYNGYAGVNLYDDLQNCTPADLERCTVNFCAAYEAPDPNGNWQANEEIGRYRFNAQETQDLFSTIGSNPVPKHSFSPVTGPERFVQKLEDGYSGRYSGQDASEAMARLETKYTKEDIAKMSQEEFNKAVDDSGYYGDFAPGTFGEGPYENPFTKENIDALPEATRKELLNRNDAVGDMVRQTYYGSNNQTKSNTNTTNLGNNINSSNVSASSSTTAQMIASDPSAQNTFKMLNNMPDAQKAIAINSLPSDLKAAYSLWNSSQSSKNISTSNTSKNNQTVWTKTSQVVVPASSVTPTKSSAVTTNNTKVDKSSTSTTISTNTNEVIKISYDEVMQIMQKLKNSIASIDDLLNKHNNLMNNIKSSWVAKEATDYINRVSISITKIEKTRDALKMLLDTYERVLNNSADTEQEINSVIV